MFGPGAADSDEGQNKKAPAASSMNPAKGNPIRQAPFVTGTPQKAYPWITPSRSSAAGATSPSADRLETRRL